MLTFQDDKGVVTEWHLGEPVPDDLGYNAKLEASGDELNLILNAMVTSTGVHPLIGYTMTQGFRSRLNETLQKAALALYMAAFWRSDRPLPEDGKPLWKALRDALGLEPGQSPRPISHVDSLRWLIEYRTARPVPVYAADKGYAIDPNDALHFDSRDQAKSYMLEHGYGSPWHETEHRFV